MLSLPCLDPCRSEHLIHQERPVVTQHSLRNCIDHRAALFQTQHFDLNLVYDRDYSPVKGQQLGNLLFFQRPGVFVMISFSCYEIPIISK